MSKHAKTTLQMSLAITAALLCSMTLASADETAGSITTTTMLAAPATSVQAASAAINPGTYVAAVPTVRRNELEEVGGGDAVPEIFDRNGLESWWQHYQETLTGGTEP